MPRPANDDEQSHFGVKVWPGEPHPLTQKRADKAIQKQAEAAPHPAENSPVQHQTSATSSGGPEGMKLNKTPSGTAR